LRAIWSGAISISLISIPIKVYAASQPRQIDLHMVCNVCQTPLLYKRWCPKCNKEVSWQDIDRGYKISKDRWIIIKKEDLDRIKLPTTKTIEIKEFIDVNQIDPIFFEKPYYVVPQETGVKAYSLFVEALRLANKAAIGKVVMRNKEYVVMLRSFKKGILMHVLFYLGEIKPIDELSELKNLVVVSKEELELARVLIQRLTESEFDPKKFKDAYTEALMELIKAKIEGKTIEVKEEKAVEAKELMEALKASVEAVKKKKK
jgi:DNA end-binding protein Ku